MSPSVVMGLGQVPDARLGTPEGVSCKHVVPLVLPANKTQFVPLKYANDPAVADPGISAFSAACWVAAPVPPRPIESCPVHPSVRFCAAIDPVTLVSLVIDMTTVDGRSPATSEHGPNEVAAPQVPIT